MEQGLFLSAMAPMLANANMFKAGLRSRR